ncbi:hypothetical protein Tco_0490754 [Tanacetum coccineum]
MIHGSFNLPSITSAAIDLVPKPKNGFREVGCLEVKRDEELRPYIAFKLGQFTFKLTPSRLSRILQTPHALKTFYTSKWSLNSLDDHPNSNFFGPKHDLIKNNITTPRTTQTQLLRDSNKLFLDDIRPDLRRWELFFSKNFFYSLDKRNKVNACTTYMLYYLTIGRKFNFTLMIIYRMEEVINKRKGPMPFSMLLTRLYNHILTTNPQAIVPIVMFTFHELVIDPLDISRNPSKEKVKKIASPSVISSSSLSSDDNEAPSVLEFYDELSDILGEAKMIMLVLFLNVLVYPLDEQPNERTPSPPPRNKSLSPSQAPSKSISSKSTHYTSSSSPSESPTPTHVAPPPKLCFVIPIKLEPQELPPPQMSPNDPYAQTMDNWLSDPSNPSPPPRVSRPPLGFQNPPLKFESLPSTQPFFVNINNNIHLLYNNAPPRENIHHQPPNLRNQDFPNPPNIMDVVYPNDMPHLHNMFCQCRVREIASVAFACVNDIGSKDFALSSYCPRVEIFANFWVLKNQTYELTTFIVDVFEYHFHEVKEDIDFGDCDSKLAIMPPRMRTQSASRPAAESLGEGIGVRVGRGRRGGRPREGNNECVDDLNDQGNDQGMGANGEPLTRHASLGICGKGGAIFLTRWIKKIEFMHDMSGCSVDQKVKYTAGSIMGKALTWWNSQIRILIQEVALSMSWKDLSYENTRISGTLTNEAVRNGSIKKVEKRGNMGEPSKDRSGRDDNKRTRTGNAFATTVNPVGRENTGYIGLKSTHCKLLPCNLEGLGMDSLSNHKAEIIYHEKAGDKKQEEIIMVRDFPKVFPDDLSGLPPIWEIEFRIELIPKATPEAKSPYRLVPLELEELSGQLKELQDKEVQFLGHVINGNGIHDPSKIKVVKNWKAPRTLTEIHSFLRLAGYYRSFINNFSKIAKSLTIMTQKSLPDRPEDFVVYCDVSGIELGCMLMQRGKLEAQKEAVDDLRLRRGFDEKIEQSNSLWIDRFEAKLNFVKKPVKILETEFKKLKCSRIAIVKVQWNSKRGHEFTWEREDQMKLKYPH